MTAYLPLIVGALGTIFVVSGALALLWYRKGRNMIRYCYRCSMGASGWSGREKDCPWCGAAGGRGEPPEYRFPTHDAGILDTGPIPIIDRLHPYRDQAYRPGELTDDEPRGTGQHALDEREGAGPEA